MPPSMEKLKMAKKITTTNNATRLKKTTKKEEHGTSTTQFGKSKENLKRELVCSKTDMEIC